MESTSRTGKIARLPFSLRTEVNRRLLDNQGGPTILKWLNARPEAMEVCKKHFKGEPISPQNLSEWKLGGYREWAARQDRIENLKVLSSFANELAQAGGSIADGAASILAGQILEALEQAGNFAVTGGDEDASNDPNEGLAKMASAVASLQHAQVSRGKLELDKKRVIQKDAQLALDREKYETQTVTKFLEWARTPEAQTILDSGKPKDAILSDLRTLMFGKRPDPGGEEVSRG